VCARKAVKSNNTFITEISIGLIGLHVNYAVFSELKVRHFNLDYSLVGYE